MTVFLHYVKLDHTNLNMSSILDSYHKSPWILNDWHDRISLIYKTWPYKLKYVSILDSYHKSPWILNNGHWLRYSNYYLRISKVSLSCNFIGEMDVSKCFWGPKLFFENDFLGSTILWLKVIIFFRYHHGHKNYDYILAIDKVIPIGHKFYDRLEKIIIEVFS